jgi:hypothetical protein
MQVWKAKQAITEPTPGSMIKIAVENYFEQKSSEDKNLP